jgi:ADP-ribose pyrophosphatase YjhB (NUDIX family)
LPDHSPKHSVSVAAAIIDDEGRFLAIRRADNGAWEPPGGVLELDESIEAGLVREVEEETGLRVEPVALTGVYKNMRRGIVALVFRCRVLGETPHPTTEAVEVRWFTPEQLHDCMTEAYRVRLIDALDDDRASVRAHDGSRLVAEHQATP